MYSADDFKRAAIANIGDYPTLAALYAAGDPLVSQNIGAIAAMLGMLSGQMETAMSEPFGKSRDATILADAAIRGIVPKARPGQVFIALTNNSPLPYNLSENRILTDTVGNKYLVQTPITLAAGASGTIAATQVYTQQYSYTVSESVPFYPIQIPTSTDGSFLSGIDVFDNSLGIAYSYASEYINILPGDYVYHIEADDKQLVYVRFGDTNTVGYQPPDGTVINLTVYWSMGAISLAANSPFSLQYVLTPQESQVVFTLSSISDPGANPMDIVTLRDFARYPAVYDVDAVFLGEFDYLVRRSYSDAQFLSVWNETFEEGARGANIANINRLFVAFLSGAGTEAIVTEAQYISGGSLFGLPISTVQPTTITSLTVEQSAILDMILNADDSYNVVFYTPVKSLIYMSVNAFVSTSYVASDVSAQITSLILATFGINSASSAHPNQQILNQQVYKLLASNIEALSDGQADFQISIVGYPGVYRPELWRYVDSTSLSVSVTLTNTASIGWR